MLKSKTILFLIAAFLLLAGCNSGNKKTGAENKAAKLVTAKKSVSVSPDVSEGYRLMQQKCFICHMATPDSAKKNQMIAPPMVRVQEHYKPAYPGKNDFMKATKQYINNPSEVKTLMPGAVKRFKLMPKLIYTDNELTLITEALYEINFHSNPAMNRAMNRLKLQLNHGEKWKLKPASVEQVDHVVSILKSFNSSSLTDYHKLGKEVFNLSKTLLLDKSYTGDVYLQLQAFFHGVEDNMHVLIAARSTGEADRQVTILKKKFKQFYQYFE